MARRVDCYGRAEGDAFFGTRHPAAPGARRAEGGVTYVRYGAGDAGPVHRLEVGADGLVRAGWAWGRLEDAESLGYRGLDETMEADA